MNRSTLVAPFAALALSLLAAPVSASGTIRQAALYHAPAEAREPGITAGIGVYDARIDLLEDYDGDGYYSQFTVRYDADALQGNGLYAYTVVSLVTPGGSLLPLTTSPTFWIGGNTGYDSQAHTVTLNDGTVPASYRLRVDLYDACCGTRLDTLVTSSVEPLPLEDQYYDDPGGYTEVVYEENPAGGSLGVVACVAFAGLAWVRRRPS